MEILLICKVSDSFGVVTPDGLKRFRKKMKNCPNLRIYVQGKNVIYFDFVDD